MLDILLLILLVVGLIVGFTRGLVVQLIHMVGFIIALFVARLYYEPLADHFDLWVPYPAITEASRFTIAVEKLDLTETFYQMFSFALIFFVTWFVLQILASILNFLKFLPVLGFFSRILGAFFGLVEAYILLFFALYLFALLPVAIVQDTIGSSFLAQLLLEHTPVLTEQAKDWWYIYLE
ncbi:CvpA family protein [Indiicoccus explosivorum]|uniref:CvpA family protein n=1 Tax=Indiicoccus explosivorum TaxID=1917864 RepID=UPI000B44C156|nr:CvpA family protein [Indiicoccus explosivorum]